MTPDAIVIAIAVPALLLASNVLETAVLLEKSSLRSQNIPTLLLCVFAQSLAQAVTLLLPFDVLAGRPLGDSTLETAFVAFLVVTILLQVALVFAAFAYEEDEAPNAEASPHAVNCRAFGYTVVIVTLAVLFTVGAYYGCASANVSFDGGLGGVMPSPPAAPLSSLAVPLTTPASAPDLAYAYTSGGQLAMPPGQQLTRPQEQQVEAQAVPQSGTAIGVPVRFGFGVFVGALLTTVFSIGWMLSAGIGLISAPAENIAAFWHRARPWPPERIRAERVSLRARTAELITLADAAGVTAVDSAEAEARDRPLDRFGALRRVSADRARARALELAPLRVLVDALAADVDALAACEPAAIRAALVNEGGGGGCHPWGRCALGAAGAAVSATLLVHTALMLVPTTPVSLVLNVPLIELERVGLSPVAAVLVAYISLHLLSAAGSGARACALRVALCPACALGRGSTMPSELAGAAALSLALSWPTAMFIADAFAPFVRMGDAATLFSAFHALPCGGTVLQKNKIVPRALVVTAGIALVSLLCLPKAAGQLERALKAVRSGHAMERARLERRIERSGGVGIGAAAVPPADVAARSVRWGWHSLA